MDPAFLCKVFFTLGSAVDIGGTFFPSFRNQVMNYGSRSIPMQPTTTGSRTARNASRSHLQKLFNFMASFQVPHTWFIHYYMISVACSIFWAYQITTQGSVFQFLVHQARRHGGYGRMTINQVLLAWSFMMLQGSRRLYECVTLTKPSQSKMWAGLWLIGIAYYVAMSLSVWIEGIRKISFSFIIY